MTRHVPINNGCTWHLSYLNSSSRLSCTSFSAPPYWTRPAGRTLRQTSPRARAMSAANLVRRLYYCVRGVAIVIPWILHLALADILLSALLPLSAVFPTLTYHLSSRLADSAWRAIQRVFTRLNGAIVTTSGASLPEGESAIVVCNHVSWSDFYIIQALAIRSRMLGYSRWFAKQQLKWVPFLGWGLWALSMPLVSRNWLRDQRELNRVFGGLVRRQWPMCTPASIQYRYRVCWTLLMRQQGSSLTVKGLASPLRSMPRLSPGARPTIGLYRTIRSTRGPKALWPRSSSCATRLTSRPFTMSQ